jgi:hypothetical protein
VEEQNPIRFGVGIEVGADVGILPDPSLSMGGALSLTGPAWRLGLRGAWWVPRQTDDGPRDGSGAIVGLVGGSAKGCWTFFSQVVALDACGTVEAAWARGRGQGLQNPRDADEPWVATGPSFGLRSNTWPLRALLFTELPVALARPAFTIDGFGEIHQAAPVAFRLGVGTEVAFP